MNKIFVTTEFEGIHCWPEAPNEVFFLRDPHRHMFKIRIEVEVQHHDRDIEFIMFKREIDNYIKETFLTDHSKDTYCGIESHNRISCEDIASNILTYITGKYVMRKVSVEVSEDGENGAIVSTF